MVQKPSTAAAKSPSIPGKDLAPTEGPLWRSIGGGWHPVFGSFQDLGYSIEWHDFLCQNPLNWGASFHPGSIELCLNLAGNGYVQGPESRAEFAEGTVGFYRRLIEPLQAVRQAGERHQFLTAEYSTAFLAKHFSGAEGGLHPVVRAAIEGSPHGCGPTVPVRLAADHRLAIAALREPPVQPAAHSLWYQCKALELAVIFFYPSQAENDATSTRQKRVAQERVDQVLFLLKQNLAEPPTLEELSRKIGCSPFYLSRTFSSCTGQTITQHLRDLRMEKAAELLRSGDYNVTEVALEVGYASPSHFSQAFHEAFGCCPGLYPVATHTQQGLAKASPGKRR